MMTATETNRELVEILSELERRKKYNGLFYAFPIEGTWNRYKYQHALEFFKAGSTWRQRLYCAANRVGKTYTCAYEVALHATGRYEYFEQGDTKWEGRRFYEPTKIWAVGLTHAKVRQSIQNDLLGPHNDIGSGLIPKDHIVKVVHKNGNSECVLLAYVKHFTHGVYDGDSCIEFMAYEQGPDAFQATSIHVVWLDEEPPDPSVHTECATRTMKTSTFPGGILMLSFTPWHGATKTVMQFLPDARVPANHEVPATDTWAVNVGWDDVPHLDEETKDALRKKFPAWQVGARTKGLISVGVGQVYPISEAEYVVEDFPIPSWWPRVYGMDVGYNCTAVVWFAQNPNTSVWYVYKEYYTERNEPAIHCDAILAEGKWIPGVIDPSSKKRESDGKQVISQYLDRGLNLVMANNAVNAGIQKTWSMLTSGTLKVFRSCPNLIRERRMYHINEEGKIPDKQDDHALDAERYVVNSGLVLAIPMPDPDDDPTPYSIGYGRSTGVSKVTGY